jgi:hypothetical protein
MATTTSNEPMPPVTAVPTTSVGATDKAEMQPESESPLTRKFTAEERTALGELLQLLPAALEEAAGPDGKAGAVRIWGIELDPARAATDPRVAVVLMKFLRARCVPPTTVHTYPHTPLRNLNVSEARTMLVATLRWRAEFGIDALLREEFDPAVFGALARIYGRDKAGRPVTYNVYGGNKDIKAVFGDVPRFVRCGVRVCVRAWAGADRGCAGGGSSSWRRRSSRRSTSSMSTRWSRCMVSSCVSERKLCALM